MTYALMQVVHLAGRPDLVGLVMARGAATPDPADRPYLVIFGTTEYPLLGRHLAA